jgi:hypothetical protein
MLNRHLLEALQLQVIILENRIDFLKQQFMPRIKTKLGIPLETPPPVPGQPPHVWPMTGIPANIASIVKSQQGDDPAEKLFNYVLSVDPDPVKKNSQWLFNQILRKPDADRGRAPMPLEDLESAGETLTTYAEMKKNRQIPKDKFDINAFKSLSDLAATLRGEIVQQEQASDAEEQEMLAQCDVYANTPELFFVHPKTKAAACYFSRNAYWCTAAGDPKGRAPHRTNRFDQYNDEGPLYIVLDRQTNEWYQLHFPTNQFHGADDRAIGNNGLANLVRKFPIIAKTVGEDKFLRYAEYLGLSFFSKNFINSIPAERISRYIKSKADLKYVPDRIRDYDFMCAVCYKYPEAVKWFPKDFVAENAMKLAQNVVKCFKYLPSEFQTEENANNIVEQHSFGYRAIENIIPKELQNTKFIQDKYWGTKVSAEIESIKIKDIPEHYRPVFVVSICRNRPVEIKGNEDLLDEGKAIAIVEGNANAIEFIPEQYLTEKMVEPFEGALIDDEKKKKYYYNDSDPRKYWLRFNYKLRPASAVKWLIDHNKLKNFNEIPEASRTTEILAKFIKANESDKANKQNKIRAIPKQYWTDDLLKAVIDRYSDVLENVDPSFVPEDLLISLIGVGRHGGLDDWFYEYKLPKSYKTERLVSAFVAKGQVPIKDIPKKMMTEENIIKRISTKGSSDDGLGEKAKTEAVQIPPKMFNDNFAIKLVVANPDTIKAIPESCYTERLLYAWLVKVARGNRADRHHYDHHGHPEKKKIFEKFPKSMWSSRSLAIAVSQQYLDADSKKIPTNLIDKHVASAIVAINPDEMDNLSGYVLDHDDKISAAVLKNWRLIKKLPSDKINEPMAFAIMTQFAHTAHNYLNSRYGEADENAEMKNTLLLVPKKVWSKRVYQAAVGYIVTLKEVPAKWRDTEMTVDAVNREPVNIKYVPKPAEWLNANKNSLKLDKYGIRTPLESAGFPMIKGKFVDVSLLDKQPLPSDDSYVLVKAGPENSRVYFFDKKGKFLFYMYTVKGKISLDKKEIVKAKGYRDDILAMMRKEYSGSGIDPGEDLNDLGIYKNPDRAYNDDGVQTGEHYIAPEEAKKKNFEGIEYTETSHGDGSMFIFWNKKGTKYVPVMSIEKGYSKGSWGAKGGDPQIESVTISDKSYGIKNSAKIAKFINKFVRAEDWSSELNNIGIFFKPKDGGYGRSYNFDRADTFVKDKIGNIGKYTIYRNDNKIAIFSASGMVASAIIRAKGNIDKPEFANRYRYNDEKREVAEEKMKEMFNKISDVLIKNKDAKNIKLEEMLRKRLTMKIF